MLALGLAGERDVATEAVGAGGTSRQAESGKKAVREHIGSAAVAVLLLPIRYLRKGRELRVRRTEWVPAHIVGDNHTPACGIMDLIQLKGLLSSQRAAGIFIQNKVRW